MKGAAIGALVAIGAYLAYEWNKQKASWPNGVPLGNLVEGQGMDWAIGLGAVVVGAIAGYAVTR